MMTLNGTICSSARALDYLLELLLVSMSPAQRPHMSMTAYLLVIVWIAAAVDVHKAS